VKTRPKSAKLFMGYQIFAEQNTKQHYNSLIFPELLLM
jgi:hypothetical protein